DDGGLFSHAADEGKSIAEAYEACDYNRAMRQIMALADRANQYVDAKAPWTLQKRSSYPKKPETRWTKAEADRVREEAEREAGQILDSLSELQDICTVALNLFRQLAVYLAPVLPQLAKQAGELLNDPITNWDQSKKPLAGAKVNKFQPMLTRVEPAQVQAMMDDTKESAPAAPSAAGAAAGPADGPEALQAEPLAPECTIDDFTKVDLRVARILTAEEVPDARKLLKLTLSLGGDVRKTVFAG